MESGEKRDPCGDISCGVFLEWLCLVLGEPVNTSNVEMKVAGGVLPVVGELRKCQGSLQHVP